MKHWLRQYEALANACMKRSAFFVPNVPKARFIAVGDFMLHAPSGALHSAKTKRQALPVLLFWRRRRDSSAAQCNSKRRSAPLPLRSAPRGYPNSPPDCLAYALRISSKAKQKTTRLGGFCLAEKERFELSNGFIRYTISSRAPSTS